METDSPVSQRNFNSIRKQLFHSSYASSLDSPVSTRELHLVAKRLFHSPHSSPLAKHQEQSEENVTKCHSKKSQKRKHLLLPSSSEKFQKGYIKEKDSAGHSPEVLEGMRKKTLISLFHNKEYIVDMSFE